jgi:hypothetical protein
MTGPAPTPDNDGSKPPFNWRSYRRRVAVELAVFFVVYVLSLGPMYWQWYAGKYLDGSRLIAAFYEPLYRLCGWVPPLGWFVNWYLTWWVA